MAQSGMPGAWQSSDDTDDIMQLTRNAVVSQAPVRSTTVYDLNRLSPEARAIIYRHIIGNEPIVYLAEGDIAHNTHPSHALLRVSKSIRREVLPLVANIKVVLRGFSEADVKLWIQFMGSQRIRKLKRLRIEVEARCGRSLVGPTNLQAQLCKRIVEIDMRNAEPWHHPEGEDAPNEEGTTQYLSGAKTWTVWHTQRCITVIPECGNSAPSSGSIRTTCCQNMVNKLVSALEITKFHSGLPHLDGDMILRISKAVSEDQRFPRHQTLTYPGNSTMSHNSQPERNFYEQERQAWEDERRHRQLAQESHARPQRMHEKWQKMETAASQRRERRRERRRIRHGGDSSGSSRYAPIVIDD